jgi:phage tail-like protein
MAIATSPAFRRGFKFHVIIQNIAEPMGCQKCDGLAATITEVKHHQGGQLIPTKSAGLMEFQDVTLTRGATSNSDLYNWFIQVGNAAISRGISAAGYKRNVTIVQRGIDDSIVDKFVLYNAFIKSYKPGSWDNDTASHLMEEIVISYDYFERQDTVADPDALV